MSDENTDRNEFCERVDLLLEQHDAAALQRMLTESPDDIAIPALISMQVDRNRNFITGECSLLFDPRKDEFLERAFKAKGEAAAKLLIQSMEMGDGVHLALGWIGGENATHALLGELKHDYWRRREAACNGLCAMTDQALRGALPAIRDLLRVERSAEVTWAANRALKHIEEVLR